MAEATRRLGLINIQIHGVISAKWEKDEDRMRPRVLHIETLEGPQAISLFPVRPKADPLANVKLPDVEPTDPAPQAA